MRTGLVLAFALFLGGCGGVVSKQPWFAETLGHDADQVFRPGLWRLTRWPPDDAENCTFDPALPSDKWPSCAPAIVFRQSGFSFLPGGQFQGSAHMVVGFPDPVVVQVSPAETDNSTRGAAGALYFIADQPERDANGRIIRFGIAPILCDGRTIAPGRRTRAQALAGPISLRDPQGPPSTIEPPPTQGKPLPGIVLLRDGGCIARSRKALIAAALASRGKIIQARAEWVGEEPTAPTKASP